MRERERERGVSPAPTPSLDLIFDVLADRRRRFVLYYLQDQTDGVATIDETVEYVVSLETDGGRADHRANVRISLQHAHLPKLEDAGVLEYDARSEAIRYWNQPSLEEWLEHARYKERS